jgi:ElaA protein
VPAALHHAEPASLPFDLAYRILRLRVDVFVVEQQCAYPELDGRDLDPRTVWVWAADDEDENDVAATLRVLTEPDRGARIGRVATRRDQRSAGTASRLMAYALDLIGPARAVSLDAQTYLAAWYERFGFARTGAEFFEDGIAHVPMARRSRNPDDFARSDY